MTTNINKKSDEIVEKIFNDLIEETASEFKEISKDLEELENTQKADK